MTESGSRGTVCKISGHGKLLVQMEDEEIRKHSLLSLRSSGSSHKFRLERFMGKNDDALRTAAALFSLVAQDFRLQYTKIQPR